MLDNIKLQIEKRPDHIKFSGRILFLTDDTTLIRQQLEASGEAAAALEAELAARLSRGDLPLMSNISTDEITPGWVCFYYDETLGQYVYVGMREGAVKKDEVKNGGFAVVVSGLSKGLRLVARDRAVRREGRGRPTRHRAKHREDLRAELPEHRPADLHRFRIDRTHSSRRGDPAFGVHERARSDLAGHRFAWRSVQLQQGASRRRSLAAAARTTAPRPMTIVEKIIARTRL